MAMGHKCLDFLVFGYFFLPRKHVLHIWLDLIFFAAFSLLSIQLFTPAYIQISACTHGVLTHAFNMVPELAPKLCFISMPYLHTVLKLLWEREIREQAPLDDVPSGALDMRFFFFGGVWISFQKDLHDPSFPSSTPFFLLPSPPVFQIKIVGNLVHHFIGQDG